jgi:hypothetical protein
VSAHWLLEVMYCTVYVPAFDESKSIRPVKESITNPVGIAVKIPPVVPVIVGVGSLDILQ